MVTINELKKEKINAIKEHDANKQNILSVLITNYQLLEIEKRSKNEEINDADMLSLLNKSLKALQDEKQMYEGGNKKKDADDVEKQIKLIQSYLPQLMSEGEIRKIVSSLEDKSIKNIMIHFKTNYAGKVDFGVISKVAKEFNN